MSQFWMSQPCPPDTETISVFGRLWVDPGTLHGAGEGVGVVVAAGGNDGRSIHRLGNPAIDPFVIAVGAAQRGSSGWNVPSWSSSGDGVRNPDLVAPGAAILAAAVPGSYLTGSYPAATCVHPDSGQLFLRGSGTSQAAAVTSGAVAVLLEQRPDLTPDQVKAIVTSSTASMNSDNDTQSGAGLLMAERTAGKNCCKASSTSRHLSHTS